MMSINCIWKITFAAFCVWFLASCGSSNENSVDSVNDTSSGGGSSTSSSSSGSASTSTGSSSSSSASSASSSSASSSSGKPNSEAPSENNQFILDTSFGEDPDRRLGISRQHFSPDVLQNLLVLENDQYMLASEESSDTVVISRFHSDGALDESYGIDGRVSYSLDGADLVETYAIEEKSDGSIFLAITGLLDSRIVSFDSEGNLDTDFGSNGVTILSDFFDGSGIYNTVKIADIVFYHENNSLYIAGKRQYLFGTSAAVLRLTANGQFDNDFGQNGIVLFTPIVNSADPESYILSMALADENLYFGGLVEGNPAVFSLDLNGGINVKFGLGNGYVVHEYDGVGYYRDLVVRSSGDLVLVGTLLMIGEPQVPSISIVDRELGLVVDQFNFVEYAGEMQNVLFLPSSDVTFAQGSTLISDGNDAFFIAIDGNNKVIPSIRNPVGAMGSYLGADAGTIFTTPWNNRAMAVDSKSRLLFSGYGLARFLLPTEIVFGP